MTFYLWLSTTSWSGWVARLRTTPLFSSWCSGSQIQEESLMRALTWMRCLISACPNGSILTIPATLFLRIPFLRLLESTGFLFRTTWKAFFSSTIKRCQRTRLSPFPMLQILNGGSHILSCQSVGASRSHCSHSKWSFLMEAALQWPVALLRPPGQSFFVASGLWHAWHLLCIVCDGKWHLHSCCWEIRQPTRIRVVFRFKNKLNFILFLTFFENHFWK